MKIKVKENNKLVKRIVFLIFFHNLLPVYRLLSDYQKCELNMKELFNTKYLKYKDIDDLNDIFESWDTKVPFKLSEYRE